MSTIFTIALLDSHFIWLKFATAQIGHICRASDLINNSDNLFSRKSGKLIHFKFIYENILHLSDILVFYLCGIDSNILPTESNDWNIHEIN